MKALILAAGYGTRLGELTKKVPKPLLEIGGKTIVERIIERLHVHGITQIVVNVHYLPTIITERLDSNALYFYEPKLLGHKKTIWALKQWLEDDDFFVINGDTISNVDYTQMKLFHRDGYITAAMDEWRCIGTWVYPKSYFTRPCEIEAYRPLGLDWHDIGTPKRLKEAKKFYGKKPD